MENKKSSKLENTLGVCGVAGCILLTAFVYLSKMPEDNERRLALEKEIRQIHSKNYSIKKSTTTENPLYLDISDPRNPASPYNPGNPASLLNPANPASPISLFR